MNYMQHPSNKTEKRFSLYCSYDECLRNGVEIIGVNYHRPKSEQRNAMHFRENERFSHHGKYFQKMWRQKIGMLMKAKKSIFLGKNAIVI
ncbi:hypothetical protein [Moraxella oculi]|uniref:Uncharacterized protein n=1 Tax=Moraxella oculi TaxID=2940516 RepID=A0ABW8U9V1_9GAMM